MNIPQTMRDIHGSAEIDGTCWLKRNRPSGVKARYSLSPSGTTEVVPVPNRFLKSNGLYVFDLQRRRHSFPRLLQRLRQNPRFADY
jgi:hypothetical protein